MKIAATGGCSASRSWGSRTLGRQCGFTLLELMVVIVLIGIMTAMILPEMKGSYEDALLRSTARKLVGIFNLANSRAISVGQSHRVRLDTREGRFLLERFEDESDERRGFLPVRDSSESAGELDKRIEIEIRKRQEEAPAPSKQPSRDSAEDSAFTAEANTITFFADGTADAGEIVLRDRDGFRLGIRINPTTARIRIIELERESVPGPTTGE